MPYRPKDLTISSNANVVDDMYVPSHRQEELDDWLQRFNVKPRNSDEYNGREYLDFLTHQLKFNNEMQKQEKTSKNFVDSSQTSKTGVKDDEQKKRLDRLKAHMQLEENKLSILRRKREAEGITEESSQEKSIKEKIEYHQDEIELLEK